MNLPKTLSINGERKEWLYLLRGRQEAPFAPHDIETVSAPGKEGAHLGRTNVELKRIDQPIGFTVRDEEHEQELLDELNAFLLTQENAEIQFDNVPGKTYIGRVTGSISDYSRPAPTLREGTITFLCEPYKYGPEKEVVLTGQGTIINVEGTQAAKPTFEFDVLAPITFAMVSNGDEYMLIGRIPSDNQNVFGSRQKVLEERGQTLSEWSTASQSDVDSFIELDGKLAYDGTGIFADSYGDGQAIHGPALIKDLESPLNNFEIETTFDIISNYDRDGFRMELYMFDENMNQLGKMGINDNSQYRKERIGLARVGDYQNDEYASDTSYLINQNNYQRTDLGDVSLMYLRVKREQNQFTFYIAEIRNGKHFATIERTFTDKANDFNGALRYVQIFIGNWGDRPRTFRTRINYINVFELIQPADDDVPFIADEGDQITFDHEDEEILINGEDATSLKDFGAEYFELPSGESELAMLPNDLEGIAKYRPTYK